MTQEQMEVATQVMWEIMSRRKYGESEQSNLWLKQLYEQAEALGLTVDEEGFINRVVPEREYYQNPKKYNVPLLTSKRKGELFHNAYDNRTDIRRDNTGEVVGDWWNMDDQYIASMLEYDQAMEEQSASYAEAYAGIREFTQAITDAGNAASSAASEINQGSKQSSTTPPQQKIAATPEQKQ